MVLTEASLATPHRGTRALPAPRITPKAWKAAFRDPGERGVSDLEWRAHDPHRSYGPGRRACAVRLRARAGAAAPAVGRGGRVRRPQRRLPRARGRLSGDRAVPLPPEARASAPRARRRQPRGARLRPRFRAAALEG